MVFRNDGQCFLVLEGKEIGEFSGDHLIGGFREGIPFMTVIDVAERQVETSLQQEITNRCTQLDARAATELLFDTTGNIQDISGTSLHISVLHGGKHLGKIIRRYCDSIFGIDRNGQLDYNGYR